MNNKRLCVYAIFLSFLGATVFSSCTIIGAYYLVNEMDYEILLELELYDQVEFEEGLFISKDEYNGKKIKYDSYMEMAKEEIVFQENSNIVSIKIPSNHLVFIGPGGNLQMGSVKSVSIRDGQMERTIVHNDFKTKSSLFGRYVSVFFYEN